MTQPKFAPIGIEDEVRPIYRLEVPRQWVPHRPGDFDPRTVREETGAGPDQGYLALLAERFVDAIVLGPGEHRDDALAGAIAIGMARASLFGRAPVLKDVEYALRALGYFLQQSPDLVKKRAELVGGVAHDLWRRKELVAMFTDDLLRMPAEKAAEQIWK